MPIRVAAVPEPSPEVSALWAVLADIAPSAQTACTEWLARDVFAHVAAGAKERADLIEEKLAGLPERPTRPFLERQAPFLALPDAELRTALIRETRRFETVAAALSQSDAQATVLFTGARFSGTQLATHQRSEAALHRWDLVGHDEIGDLLLAKPELTRHAVMVLNALEGILGESATARGQAAGVSAVRITLRSPGHAEVILALAAGKGRFEVSEDASTEGSALVTTDAAQRFLIIWGRRPSTRPITIEAKTIPQQVVESVLWPAAILWPTKAPQG